MNNPATFYIVRHSETDWNVKHLMQGHSDSQLTSKGVKDSEKLAKKLKPIKFDLIFSSDLSRARRTAEAISLDRDIAIKTTELIRERRYGEFEGKHNSEYEVVNEALDKLSEEQRYTYKHSPGIESDEEVVTRFLTFIREVAVANPGKTILAVSHGGIMRAFMKKLGLKNTIRGGVRNNAYIKLETDGVEFEIKETSGITFSD